MWLPQQPISKERVKEAIFVFETVEYLGIDGNNGAGCPIPPKRKHNAMNVVTALRADEDIGPYQLLCPQLCDNTV